MQPRADFPRRPPSTACQLMAIVLVAWLQADASTAGDPDSQVRQSYRIRVPGVLETTASTLVPPSSAIETARIRQFTVRASSDVVMSVNRHGDLEISTREAVPVSESGIHDVRRARRDVFLIRSGHPAVVQLRLSPISNDDHEVVYTFSAP
ncbi:MAG: hypothetical protein KDA96_27360 [Planctomycetaceae bacterium]|nr:hypothetical protein [Planctomycetaceae bacterium]